MQYLLKIYNINSGLVKSFYFLLILLTVIIFLLWLFRVDVKYFDLEAAFVILSMLSTTHGLLFKFLLDESEFSPSLAIAFGYVENFLEPAITQLIHEGKNPMFHIYRPNSIQELFEKNVTRTRKTIESKGFTISDIVLSSKYTRARDIILVEKEKGKQTYFDFPGTLISLLPYIDFKIASRSNDSNEEEKEELGKKLIEKFFEKIETLVQQKGIAGHIKICDERLQIEI